MKKCVKKIVSVSEKRFSSSTEIGLWFRFLISEPGFGCTLQKPQDGQMKFNNVKNNVPLLNGFEIAVLVGFIVSICAILLILNLTTNRSKHFHQQFVYKEFAIMVFYNIIGPLMYLTKKKEMRKYVWEYVTYVMF